MKGPPRAHARLEAVGVAVLCGAVLVGAAELVLETFAMPKPVRLPVAVAFAVALLVFCCWRPSGRGPA